MVRNVLKVGSTWFHEAEVRLLIRALCNSGFTDFDYPTRFVCNKLGRSLGGVVENPTEEVWGLRYKNPREPDRWVEASAVSREGVLAKGGNLWQMAKGFYSTQKAATQAQREKGGD